MCVCVSWFCLFLRERKNIKLAGCRDGEDLGGIGGGEDRIKTYCMDFFFNFKKIFVTITLGSGGHKRAGIGGKVIKISV